MTIKNGLAAAFVWTALSVGGCSAEPSPQAQSVPVEAAPDGEIPTDGSIHVVKRGRFVVAPTTLFCGIDAEVDNSLSKIGVRGLGIDGIILGNALQERGQSTQHRDGSNRQRMLDEKHCKDDGNNVIYSGRVAMNRIGKPYRLTLVVRQANALWQGVIERTQLSAFNREGVNLTEPEEGPLDESPPPTPEMIVVGNVISSIRLDSDLLGRSAVEHVVLGAK